jgi:DNA-binding MarR family transcriptional regulator
MQSQTRRIGLLPTALVSALDSALHGKVRSSSVSKTDYEALAAFRSALRHFSKFSEDAARAVGLTPVQHQALLAVKGFPEREHVTIGELAERLQIAHHSAVGLVNRLVARGFLFRTPGAKDRRQVFVSVTKQGAALLETLTETHRGELRRLGPQLESLLASLNRA